MLDEMYNEGIETKSRSRVDRVLNRLPKFLHPWTNGLRAAPGSNVVAFLILHELTAIVPLVGLAGLFHYTNWLPRYWTEARYISDGTEKFGRYFARKGWFGFERTEHAPVEVKEGVQHVGREEEIKETEERWGVRRESSRILVEVATAYAITKVFLPARIVASVWATPWFARVVVGRVGYFFGTMGKSNKVAAPRTKSAGTIVSKGHKP